MKLRDYQEKAIKAITEGFKNKRKQMIVLPTGSGKTVIFWNIIKELKTKTLILVHTKELIDQVLKTGNQCFPNIKCSLFNDRNNCESVHINTIQASTYPKCLLELKKQDYSLIIVDECHRSAAKSYRRVLEGLEVDKKNLLGVTATPFRNDRQSIYEIFSFPDFTISLAEMIDLGYLCDLQGYRVKTNCSLKGLRKQKGDFQIKKLESVINVKNRNELIVKEYLSLSANEKAIAFCLSVNHAREVRDEFLRKNISCEIIHGKLPDPERKACLKRFREGITTVLVNCQILTEGFDEPSVKTLLMARPTCSQTLYTQMIGRGARLFPSKKVCKVIEFTDNDFETWSLASCADSNRKNVKMENGELFSRFNRRIKELQDSLGETVVQEINIVPRAPAVKLATSWQIKELQRRGVSFIEPLTESTANYLLSQE